MRIYHNIVVFKMVLHLKFCGLVGGELVEGVLLCELVLLVSL